MSDQLSSDLASLRIDRSGSQPSPRARASASSASTASAGSSSSVGPKLTRTLLALVVVGALGAAGWVGYGKMQTRIFPKEIATTEVLVISPSQAEVLVTATGYVIPQTTSKVGSKIAGRVAKVNVKEGDEVKAGDILAQLEDNDQRTNMAAANSRAGVALARAEAARASAREVSQQVERERALVASGAVGKASLDDLIAREQALKAVARAAGAEAHAAGADAKTVHVTLKDHVIISPIDGRVVGKPVTVGEFVGGATGPTQVAEIVDFRSLMVEADVPEARLHIVKMGGPAEIVLDAYPDKRYRGTVVEFGQRVNRSKATVVAKVKFDDSLEGVLPDMSARVSFLSKRIADEEVNQAPKRVVPSDAVVQRGGQSVVFVVDNGTIHAQSVKLGGPVGGNVELIDGPAPGTKIVSQPGPEVSDGQKIKERDKS